ncbi:hypothetical protein [Flavobacterium hercynium]|uniref:Uncharacterized protein n=1 Tax=Flavobacterium hercynium TaxID=387094 RepID=A0A226GYV4_9FLAO|nr:hypothetical protein [Flavobacterium hercynium]OXA86904.1 hypothetical protein B0A66_17200 [Flavobacterium hercynium]SMP37134.1 hypothetical protein SAMN06265346_12716 [Flavobacterium hercynium]
MEIIYKNPKSSGSITNYHTILRLIKEKDSTDKRIPEKQPHFLFLVSGDYEEDESSNEDDTNELPADSDVLIDIDQDLEEVDPVNHPRNFENDPD